MQSHDRMTKSKLHLVRIMLLEPLLILLASCLAESSSHGGWDDNDRGNNRSWGSQNGHGSDKWKNDKWSGGGGDTFFLRMPVVAPLSCLAS